MTKGKSKGSAFERKICKDLSLWVSNGTRTDLFWRSALSGGRSTRRHSKGENVNVQLGDICAVHPTGHPLTDKWYVECKHYRNLHLTSFMLTYSGPLASFWTKAQSEAEKYNRLPMLIAKQNNYPCFVLISKTHGCSVSVRVLASMSSPHNCSIVLFNHLVAGPVLVS